MLILAAVPAWSSRKKQALARPLRVACVGNSVTYGYGLANRGRDAYPVRLQVMLDSAYGVNRFEVGNFGHSGSTLLRKGHRPYMNLPEFRQALDFKADWVVIHLGLNDTDPRNWPDWKEEFIPDYRALIDSFRAVNPEARILICKMTPIFDRHSRFQSGTRDWHAQIQQAIAQVAQGAGVQLIDLFTPLHSRPDLFPDALHPNPEGALILAKTVYGALTGDHGGLRLPPVYSSGMVLPRDEHLLIEGSANARCSIRRVLSKDGKVVDEGETFTYADDHIVYQCAIESVESLFLLIVHGAVLVDFKRYLTIFDFHLNRWVNLLRQFTFRAFHSNDTVLVLVDCNTRRNINRQFSYS